jgi:pimeloyl-ACP methyl ester carboxylesterase
MARPILMPQVGQDLTEGKITALNVKLGDRVKKGDIVAEVESEKAAFDVEAFESGTVIEIRYQVGDMATVLQPIMVVGEPGEAPEQAVTQASPAASAATMPHQDGKTLHGPAVGRTQAGAGSSPLARRLAAEAGVDVALLKGTGPGGAVVKKDVDSRRKTPLAIAGGSPLRSLQPGSGDPVVFIHGFGADLSAWRPFIPHLGLPNPILALDLPGHGANADLAAEDFGSLAARVREALAASGLNRFHLAAHSLGAAVAARLAGDGGLDIRSLSLLSPAGLGPRINGDFIAGFLSAGSEAALRAWLELLVHKPSTLPGALVRATLAARDAGPLATAQARLAAGVFSGNTQLFSIRDALDRYPGPLRVIIGNEDRIIPAAYADQLPPHAALHRLALVGHLPQLEATALVARLVAETVRSAG